jgi:hypothetical protein
MAERPNKRARQDKDQGENNVLLTDIFDDDMLNEINEYESEHSDDEYVYEDPVHDNLHVLAISNDSDEDINGDSNGDSNADRQVAENTKEDEIRKKVSSSTLSKKQKVFQSHMASVLAKEGLHIGVSTTQKHLQLREVVAEEGGSNSSISLKA